MSTISTSNLNDMLREYAPYSLIMDEFKRDNYAFNQFKIDKSWKNGSSFQIPWDLGAGANDTQMGGLVDVSNIGPIGSYKKAILNNPPEMWGSLIFEEKDLTRFSDLKQSFLKIFPDKLTALVDHMKANVACMVLRGGALCIPTADGTSGGVLVVDKPQFLSLGQRVLLKSSAASTIAFVAQIDMNNKAILFQADRVGTTLNLSTFHVADGLQVLVPGQDTESIKTLASYLLPASMGGLDTIHGFSKLASPLLQPQVIDGSGMTSATALDSLYDYYFAIKQLGKVKEAELWVPYSVFKACAKEAMIHKRFTDGGKSSGYGFSKMSLIGPEGEMTITALADMPGDKIYILDTSCFNFVGDSFFDRKRQLNSDDEFFVIRADTGYRYVSDICFRAEFIATKLSTSAVVHNIPLNL